ncbi:MAG: ribonuclease VapC9 [Chloroflexota bacterium]|nr:MAG: ribonuclease VapC9 [Chloroflexota bacterium]
MLVVDASSLYDVLVEGPSAEAVRARLAADDEHAAPHLIDAEVLSLIRRDHLRGAIDATTAALAVVDLAAWPGERYDHRPLFERAWALRRTLRAWDALYVALAEALGASLVTLDARLARADGPRCPIEVVDRG